jgi:hypothetical protein
MGRNARTGETKDALVFAPSLFLEVSGILRHRSRKSPERLCHVARKMRLCHL